MIALFIFLYIVIGLFLTMVAYRYAPKHSIVSPRDWIVDDDPGEIGFTVLFFTAFWPFFILMGVLGGLVYGVGILFKKLGGVHESSIGDN